MVRSMLPWSGVLWFSILLVGPRVVCCGCVLWLCAVDVSMLEIQAVRLKVKLFHIKQPH